jgi:hypothetical protein
MTVTTFTAPPANSATTDVTGLTLLSTTSWTSQTITLNSIVQTYKALYLTAENLDDSNGTTAIEIRLNGNTDNNYHWGFQSAVGTNSSENSNVKNRIRTNIVGNDATLVLTFPEYTTTQKHLVYGNFAWNNGNYVGAVTGYYNVAAPITSITLYRPDNGTFAGTIKLYGVN